jgi:hypothetical protein
MPASKPVARKPKSNNLLYIALAVTVVVAVYLNTGGSTSTSTTARRRVTTLSTQTTVAPGDAELVTPADYKVRFPRLALNLRDPFAAQILTALPVNPISGGKSGWNLTGINTIDGVTTAVLENSTSGDDVFLDRGDVWMGLRVIAIDTDDVVLKNALGQQTVITFASPPDPTQPGGSGQSSIPTLSAITQLPPLPAMPQRSQ